MTQARAFPKLPFKKQVLNYISFMCRIVTRTLQLNSKSSNHISHAFPLWYVLLQTLEAYMYILTSKTIFFKHRFNKYTHAHKRHMKWNVFIHRQFLLFLVQYKGLDCQCATRSASPSWNERETYFTLNITTFPMKLGGKRSSLLLQALPSLRSTGRADKHKS